MNNSCLIIQNPAQGTRFLLFKGDIKREPHGFVPISDVPEIDNFFSAMMIEDITTLEEAGGKCRDCAVL